jgi:GTP cyclohydrolase I
MNEIQNQRDSRNLNIQKVGVKDIKYPIIVLDKKKSIQHTVANINMYVDLPHKFKGTHMSRFIEILNQYQGKITVKNYSTILKAMKKKLRAKSAHLEVEFPYFIEKKAPITKSVSLMEYSCKFVGSQDTEYNFHVEVQVPITTLCPCSKEMSKKGAHSQRGYVKVCFRFERFVWLEDIIHIIEESASSDVYALLKNY